MIESVLIGEDGVTFQDGGYWPTYHDYMIVLGAGGQNIQARLHISHPWRGWADYPKWGAILAYIS
jgi:hypothetical protein